MQPKQFNLSEKFLQKYKWKKPPFGFNGLGELVYMRTYSRLKANGKNEMWWETVKRVVEGTYNMQKRWIEHHQLGWNAWQAQNSAQEMYDRIFSMKFLPPGRGLWAMGTAITEERGLFAALNNCAFVSTATLKEDLAKPFCFLMDASMLGVGVGFDTKGAGQLMIKGPTERPAELFEIPDTREGWVESMQMLLNSYFQGTTPLKFNYEDIREAGAPILGFGGVSSGAEPLKEVHSEVRNILDVNIGQPITVTTIVDIMNLIGKCVVAGNVRRTAEIVFGEPFDDEYINLKNYKENPHREAYGWTSNNSIFAELGMDYTDAAKRIADNGEPGFAWLENMKAYSRMRNGKDNKDHRVAGGNPCLEQSLESYELCCLVETFPGNHIDLEDFLKTLKYAYLYAKTVTLGKTHWSETNRVMLRNRRIGCSVSGVAQFITNNGLNTLRTWLDAGYDRIQEHDHEFSDWLAIPRSVKTTSVKPSGTVSLLAGATPGLHYPESRFYIRRIRLSINSPLIDPLKKAGYKIEKAFGSEDSTVCVEIPVDVGKGIRTVSEVSMWEQLSIAAFMQRNWADNQVSCTVTFDKEKEGPQIANALNFFQYQLKGISFLPKSEVGAYKQMPYEEITESTYRTRVESLTPISFRSVKGSKAVVERFCNNDTCELEFETEEAEASEVQG
jgi:adenosylcobalamin-dependent ribonucleoside-triphosphate reductase